MTKKTQNKQFLLYVFSIFIAFVTYGFALTNFTLTIDSESPIYPHSSLELGRWGTNLVRYHLMNGLYPFFTLLFGLVFLALTAVEVTKILNLKGIFSFLFCLLFLSFPQHAYQLVFTMQADAIPLGYFFGTLGVAFYLKESNTKILKIINFILSVIFIVFAIATYQILVYIPVVLYIIYFFTQIDKPDSNIKQEFKKAFIFIGLLLISVLTYILSVKLFIKSANSTYLEGYASGNSDNPFVAFYNLLVDNIYGKFYYGEKPFLIVTLCVLFCFVYFIKYKTNTLLKISLFLALLIVPFTMSFFIRNGYHPPRLYVGSTLTFAFIIVFVLQKIPKQFYNQTLLLGVLLYLWNVFYVTNLFYTQNKIYKHDLEIAKDIKQKINQFEDFNPDSDYVYFYGSLPESNHIKLALPSSEVFGGSLFRWGEGDNWRMINFFRFEDIAYYRFMDDQASFNKVKDKFLAMPVYPQKGSIQKIENVVIVKLSQQKGFARYDWEK
ncbi:MAG TPA: glucosyltransferase domain-containing protein [Flavobacterium sp.]|nr:glucosyltransferase domain-containing protein [Flavobacterium sp.]